MSELTEAEETALGERDERVGRAVRSKLRELEVEARELRERMREVEARRSRLERHVRAGEWGYLDGIVSYSDVESLCEISPNPEDILEDPNREPWESPW